MVDPPNATRENREVARVGMRRASQIAEIGRRIPIKTTRAPVRPSHDTEPLPPITNIEHIIHAKNDTKPPP